MRAINQNEVHPLLLALLKAFDKYCKMHDIPYYAAGGTLLGTIRHHGFIPWDDDVDLFIKEPDYKRLLKLARSNPFIDEEKRYRLMLPGVVPNIYPLIKLVDTKTIVFEKNVDKKFGCGIYIDVFRMSYWPDDLKQAEILFEKQKRIKKRLQLVICGNLKKGKYKVMYPFILPLKTLMILSGRDCSYWSRKLFVLGSKNRTAHIGNLSWCSSIKDRYPSAWYEKSIEMPFEDMMLPVPAEYDSILTQFYGDYMKLPPVEKRYRHDFEGYYTD